MRWKSHVRFGGRAGETDLLKGRHRALARSHHATFQLDECRRRVQQELFGHRGRKGDSLYRAQRLLAKATERLDDHGKEKLTGLLEAGDPNGHVRMAWLAKELVRELYSHSDAGPALTFVDELVRDMTDRDMPLEVRSLGGPDTEPINNLIKRVKRGAFGFTNFANYRIRSLRYAGKPNWSLLGVVSSP